MTNTFALIITVMPVVCFVHIVQIAQIMQIVQIILTFERLRPHVSALLRLFLINAGVAYCTIVAGGAAAACT